MSPVLHAPAPCTVPVRYVLPSRSQARALAASITANCRALAGDTITYETFIARDNTLWAKADALNINADVRRMLA